MDSSQEPISDPQEQSASTVTVSRLRITDIPQELFEEIFSHCSPSDLRCLLTVNRRFFHTAVPLLYKKLAWRTYIRLLSDRKFRDGPRSENYAEAVRALSLGGPPTLTRATDWNWIEAVEAISFFPRLQSLAIDRILVPVHSFVDLVRLFSVKRFYYRSPPMSSYDFTPCRSPKSLNPLRPSALEFLDVRRLDVPDRFGYMDAGVVSVSALSATPTLKVLHADFTSWRTLSRGRNSAGWSLPTSLREIVLFARVPSNDISLDWLGTFLLDLESCAGSLEVLRIMCPHRFTPHSNARRILDCPSLREYVGPEEIIPYIRFSPGVEVIWVPRFTPLTGAPIESLAPSLSCLSRIRLLSIGSWDCDSYPLTAILSAFPDLEELSLTPLHTLDKVALLKLGRALRLSPKLTDISIIGRFRSSPEEVEEVVEEEEELPELSSVSCHHVLRSWSAESSSLSFARFSDKSSWSRASISGPWIESAPYKNVENLLFLPTWFSSFYWQSTRFGSGSVEEA
ncbi:hypothetical protein AAF712_009330 [Marasmius tenuissimus]|uniref:F-box domain-containing protein n=1 Tax=Marasmius tenuissimus TaxID=585030 RepID=A0ABR2ZQT7_9AGAR